jgi:hypothetical protein
MLERGAGVGPLLAVQRCQIPREGIRVPTFAVAMAVAVLLGHADSGPAPASDDWTVTLTETGGELGREVRTTEIAVEADRARVTRTSAAPGIPPTRSQSALPADAASRLHQRLTTLDAWSLGDFRQTQRDALDYTIVLRQGARSHTIRVSGASGSRPHLDLILAIERAAQGARRP